MSTMGYSRTESSGSGVNYGRLWAGGVATALVAALVVAAGIFVARVIFDLELWDNTSGVFGAGRVPEYMLAAALCALLATGLLHLLLLFAPQPMLFFHWMAGLAIVIVAVAPLPLYRPWANAITVSVINLVAGLAVWSLLAGIAESARKPQRRELPPTMQMPNTGETLR